MSKLNQKIVLFIEPAEKAWEKPSKIGNLFMNRFAIVNSLLTKMRKTKF